MNLDDYELSKNHIIRQHQVAVLTDAAVQAQESAVNAILDEQRVLQAKVDAAKLRLRDAEVKLAGKQRELTLAMKKFCKAQTKAAKRIDSEGA